eukprot:6172818-Pleurochrysis_carterae.AAC.3
MPRRVADNICSITFLVSSRQEASLNLLPLLSTFPKRHSRTYTCANAHPPKPAYARPTSDAHSNSNWVRAGEKGVAAGAPGAAQDAAKAGEDVTCVLQGAFARTSGLCLRRMSVRSPAHSFKV